LAGQVLLSPQGYGEVQFGADLATVERRLAQPAIPRQRDANCDFVTFSKYPNIRFMVENGIVTRADAGRNVKNVTGMSVGATLTRVKSLYPSIHVQPHKYDYKGHYLVLFTDDGRRAMLFEESRGKVTAVRAGLKPSVEYVEGCL
jgi:hypothetical protein